MYLPTGDLYGTEGMMTRYIKKPIPVEAHQFLGSKYFDGWPEWLKNAYRDQHVWFDFTVDGETLIIETSNEPIIVHIRDWVIQGVNGGLYPCDSETFEATYDRCG